MSKVTTVYAPAKINLYLNIHSRYTDGYHGMESIMLPVGIFDRLTLQVDEHHPSEFIFQCSHSHLINLDNFENILYQAASRFFSALERPFPRLSCSLEKIIPIGAGLGGGSSDAASLLRYLNRFYGHPFSKSELCRIASRIGMDVPFFIHSLPALVTGKGEIIQPFNADKGYYCLIIWPELHVSTAQAYQWIDDLTLSRLHLGSKLVAVLKNMNLEESDSLFYNDFERVLFPRYPVLKKVKKNMLKYKPMVTLMSGSGSAIFSLFTGADNAHIAYKKLKKIYKHIFLAKTLQDNSWRA